MKVRIRFSKTGKVRFVGHRDVARIWERALRRAEVPVAYSEGFSPRPKLSFGLALSVGCESFAEYLDVRLDATAYDVGRLPGRLSEALPGGMDVLAAVAVEQGTPSLQESVTSCGWTLELVDADLDDVDARCRAALAAEELPYVRERKGREEPDDLRPHLLALAPTGLTDRGVELTTELGAQPRSIRPTELVGVVFPSDDIGRVCRTHQWMTPDGAPRIEPIPLAAPTVQHAEARAS